jgi:hypothetical protein
MAGAGIIAIRSSLIQGRGAFVESATSIGQVLLEIKGEIANTRSPTSFQIGPSRHLETSSNARFVNHSCDPTCYLRLSGGTALNLISLSPLAVGDEVTLDYAMFEDERPGPPLPCFCGSTDCRGSVLGYRELDWVQRAKIRPFALPYLLRDG